jgi:hypothetical protein
VYSDSTQPSFASNGFETKHKLAIISHRLRLQMLANAFIEAAYEGLFF